MTVIKMTILAMASLSAASASAEVLAGSASVIDGDTMEIHGERVRVLDIDAPESRQTCTRLHGLEWRCGQKAALALSDWIAARPVTPDTTKLDRNDRHPARCTVGGRDIAVLLAESGLASPYRECECEVVSDAAGCAKAAQLSIWSGSFQMLWERRKAN